MTTYKYKQYLHIARGVMIFGAVMLTVFLLSKDLVLSGHITYSTDFSKGSPFFTELVPVQRVDHLDSGAKILSDPIYTTLRYPRPFQEVNLTTEFSNPDGAFIEYGYQNGPGESFHLQALNHPQLNIIFANQDTWSGLAVDSSEQQNGISADLYQKRSAPYIFAGVDQFWESLPDQQRTGYYGVEVQQPYEPESKQGTFTLPYQLRGGHTFFTSSTKDVLDITFTFADLNMVPGADDINIELSDWDGNLLATESYTDTEENQTLPEEGIRLRLRADAIDPGEVLKISLSVTGEIITTDISANTPYFVANGSIWLAGGSVVSDKIQTKPLDTETVYTSARSWVAHTPHRGSTQRVYIGPETLHIEQPKEYYTYQKSPSDTFLLNKGYGVVFEKGNVQLQGRGVFAFTQESYFSPFPWFIGDSIELENSDIAYVITDYIPPSQLTEGRFVQNVKIDLEDAFAPDKQLRTQFSIPHRVNHDPIILHEMTAEYWSEPVTIQNAKEKALRFIEREL